MTAHPELRPVDVGWVSAVMTRVVAASKPVMVLDKTVGHPVLVPPEVAAAPDGFLPLLLAVGDTVWREATGRSLGLDLQHDPAALLGFRVNAIAPGPVAPVLLSTMHAMAEVERPDMLLINDLHGPWQAAQDRMRWGSRHDAAPVPVRPAPGPVEPVRANFGGMRP